jgi:hypothetical protein
MPLLTDLQQQQAKAVGQLCANLLGRETQVAHYMQEDTECAATLRAGTEHHTRRNL